ncbi:MAG: nitrogen regulation protein NR(II) [Alphaproteobacteria bacterium]
MKTINNSTKVVPLNRAIAPDMRKLIDVLPDAVLAVDAEGVVAFSNPAAQEFFGMGKKALAARSLPELLGAGNPFAGVAPGQALTVHDLVINGKPVGSLSAVPLDDLSVIVLRCDAVPVKSEWAAKVKRALKPAQHLARMLAHEIKNPLTGIRGAAQLLASSNLGPDDRELAVLIDTETQRVMRLIDKVNVFDDAPHHQYAPLNIHEVLGQVIRLAQSGFGAKVSTQYDPSLPDIHGHADRLAQAFLNLVKNAVEAGGSVTIRTYYDATPGYNPETHARLPVCVAVEDTGCGITPGMLDKLFEPYQTTKPQGEGLGLSIVSKIIDDHGGAVDVTSAPGKTIFKVSFPKGDA